MVPFEDVLRFTRHRTDGDITLTTLYLTTGEVVTGKPMEGVLKLLSKMQPATRTAPL
jgi:hypothetical protein